MPVLPRNQAYPFGLGTPSSFPPQSGVGTGRVLYRTIKLRVNHLRSARQTSADSRRKKPAATLEFHAAIGYRGGNVLNAFLLHPHGAPCLIHSLKTTAVGIAAISSARPAR